MKQITIEQYKALSPVARMSYEPLNSQKPSKSFGIYELDVNNLSWSEVKGVMRTLKTFDEWQSVVDIYETCFNIKSDVFWQSSIVDYFASKSYIAHTFKRLKENEIRLLHGNELDGILWEQAGGKKLDPFSDIIPLIKLGKMFGKYPLDLGNKPYNEIMTLLVVNVFDGTINEKYNELKKQSTPKPR